MRDYEPGLSLTAVVFLVSWNLKMQSLAAVTRHGFTITAFHRLYLFLCQVLSQWLVFVFSLQGTFILSIEILRVALCVFMSISNFHGSEW